MSKIKKIEDRPEEVELSELKTIADDLGISYPNNIGILSLTKKIEEAKANKKSHPFTKPKKLSKQDVKIMKAKNLIKCKIAVMDPNLVGDTTAFCSCHNMIIDLARYVPLNMNIALEAVLVEDLESRKFITSTPELVDGKATGNFVTVSQSTYSVSRL